MRDATASPGASWCNSCCCADGRYEKRHSNVAAHVSPCFRVSDGDTVIIGQCRCVCHLPAYVLVALLQTDSTMCFCSASAHRACASTGAVITGNMRREPPLQATVKDGAVQCAARDPSGCRQEGFRQLLSWVAGWEDGALSVGEVTVKEEMASWQSASWQSILRQTLAAYVCSLCMCSTASVD